VEAVDCPATKQRRTVRRLHRTIRRAKTLNLTSLDTLCWVRRTVRQREADCPRLCTPRRQKPTLSASTHELSALGGRTVRAPRNRTEKGRFQNRLTQDPTGDQPNRHQLPQELRHKITRQLGSYPERIIAQFGVNHRENEKGHEKLQERTLD
jgi:hypothetical protein